MMRITNAEAYRWRRPGMHSVLPAVATWIERHQARCALHALDDHMLRDVGLSRCDVDREVSKPFWRA